MASDEAIVVCRSCGKEGHSGMFSPGHILSEEEKEFCRTTSSFLREMTEAMRRDEEYKAANPKPCGAEIDRLKPIILPLFGGAIPIGLAQPMYKHFPGDPIFTMGPRNKMSLKTYLEKHPIGLPIKISDTPEPPIHKPTQAERDAAAWPIPGIVAEAGVSQAEWVTFVKHWWNAHFSHECTCGMIACVPKPEGWMHVEWPGGLEC